MCGVLFPKILSQGLRNEDVQDLTAGMVSVLGIQIIRRLVSRLRSLEGLLEVLLSGIIAVDAYNRFEIAMESVEKLIIRSRRGEGINILGDRIWNILFLASSVVALLLLAGSLVRRSSRSVEVEAAKN